MQKSLEDLRASIPEPEPEEGSKRPWFVLSMLLVGVVLAALDLTVVVSILTTMMYDLDIPLGSIDQGAWIVTAYLLAYTVTMPFVGRVSDVYGRRLVFLAALIVFVIGSVMVAITTKGDGFGQGLGWMLAGRVVQAAGGGAMVPVSMAVVADIFPAKRRGMALGLIGAADTAGWVIGPVYGSLMLKYLGWQAIFWINVPLGLASAALIFFALKGVKPRTSYVPPKNSGKLSQLDIPGFLFLGLTLTGINLAFGGGKEVTAIGGSAFEDLEKNPLAEYQSQILIASGVCLLIFVLIELFVAKRPLLNIRTFARIPYSAANVANFIVGGSLIVALVGIALFVNTVHVSYDRVQIAFDAAIALVPFTFGMAIGSVLGGLLSDRVGYRIATMLGLTLAVLGFIIMAQWSPGWRVPADITLLFPGAGLTGFGFGIVIAPVGTAVIDWADREDIGVSAALVLIMRLVGMTIGLALLLQWALGRFRELSTNIPLDNNYEAGIKSVLARVIAEMFMASAILTALALLPALLFRRRPEADLSEEDIQRRKELSKLF